MMSFFSVYIYQTYIYINGIFEKGFLITSHSVDFSEHSKSRFGRDFDTNETAKG